MNNFKNKLIHPHVWLTLTWIIPHTLSTNHNCISCNARSHHHPLSCSCCNSCKRTRYYNTLISLSTSSTTYIQFNYFYQCVFLRTDSTLRTLHIFAAHAVVSCIPTTHMALLRLLFIHRNGFAFFVMDRTQHICNL